MAGRSLRQRAQAGTTLIELVVSVAILSLALVLLVGSFSTALINVTNEKQTTVAQAAIAYEHQKIQSAPFGSTQGYSDCFALDGSVGASCGNGGIVWADVTENDVQPGIQQWTVRIRSTTGSSVGSPVSIWKINQ
jgi:type II secretory pathway pseudopilin PulG